MSNPFVAEIRVFAGNFPPRGWAFCQGQLLPISQNTALFSLLGTNFGGDGRVTFGLPNLQGSLAGGVGNGPGLTPRVVGEIDGVETVTLLTSETPSHVHVMQAKNANATVADPSGAALAKGNYAAGGKNGAVATYQTATPDVQMNAQALTPQGSGGAHNNMMPTVALNYIIALQGVFPARN